MVGESSNTATKAVRGEMEKVRKRMRDGVGRQKRGADNGAGTNVKKCNKADTGQRMEPGNMLGSSIRRGPSLCCRVLVQGMRMIAPDFVNLMLLRAR